MDKLNISVVVPLYNEAESLPELAAWIDRVMRENGFSYELILINYGKSAALYCGCAAPEGEVVITMDADLQDSPDEIPELRRMILEEGYDLVSGWKKKRHDPIGKRWPSKFFNWTARAASGIRLHDFNCGLKAYRRKVVKAIEVYGRCTASFRSWPSRPGSAASARRSSTIAPASTAVRNSASNAR